MKHLLFFGLILATTLAAESKPLQVFILAGQSNMQGHAHVRTIEHIGMGPATKPMLAEMLDADGEPKVCELTERERLVLEKGVSNFEFHYLGSAKILGGVGKGLAEAMTELRQLKR